MRIGLVSSRLKPSAVTCRQYMTPRRLCRHSPRATMLPATGPHTPLANTVGATRSLSASYPAMRTDRDKAYDRLSLPIGNLMTEIPALTGETDLAPGQPLLHPTRDMDSIIADPDVMTVVAFSSRYNKYNLGIVTGRVSKFAIRVIESTGGFEKVGLRNVILTVGVPRKLNNFPVKDSDFKEIRNQVSDWFRAVQYKVDSQLRYHLMQKSSSDDGVSTIHEYWQRCVESEKELVTPADVLRDFFQVKQSPRVYLPDLLAAYVMLDTSNLYFIPDREPQTAFTKAQAMFFKVRDVETVDLFTKNAEDLGPFLTKVPMCSVMSD
eukprot:GFYU01018312.1.p1 GENE.GFYU01018312.1~~GFYU01018312.1.p1  ORF type:complete len:322 (-),score=58.92 GFYU01018312.1:18-983(-)